MAPSANRFVALLAVSLVAFLFIFFFTIPDQLKINELLPDFVVESTSSSRWKESEKKLNVERNEDGESAKVRLVYASTSLASSKKDILKNISDREKPNEKMYEQNMDASSVSKATNTDEESRSGSQKIPSPTEGDGKPMTEKKLIILWSVRPETDNIRWWDLVDSGVEEFAKCEWSDCELSRERSRVREASIIVFRHHDPFPEWPEVRFTNQSYVHMLNERPQPGHWWLAKFDERINITWNYRHDADVSHHKVVFEKEDSSDGKYVPRIAFASKTKSIMWAVSHCETYSKREQYAKELARYIDLDVYGDCGTLSCSRQKASNCTSQWEHQYKFHLSFENSVCRDYITEKFYRPLDREMIPIVLGGGDYSEAGPPHSYIDVRDYESPRELAKYLKYLAANEVKYNEYFQWKQKYSIRDNLRRMCQLCEIAQNPDKWARPVHRDYYKWWMKGCDNDLVSRMRKEGNW